MTEESDQTAADPLEDEGEQSPFFRRLKRCIDLMPKASPSSRQFFQIASHVNDSSDNFPCSVENLWPLASGGSETALSLLEHKVTSIHGLNALRNDDILSAVHDLADVYRKASLVVRWDRPSNSLAEAACVKLTTGTSQDAKTRAEAYFVRANLMFFRGNTEQGLSRLHIAQRLLPEDSYFPAVEGCILAMELRREEAYESLTLAAELGCPDIEYTLFHRALVTDDRTEGQVLLEDFVSRAAPDARRLPEAYYRLAILHGMQGPNHLGEARRHFDRGLEADRKKLPIFHDEVQSFRSRARALVEGCRACSNHACTAPAHAKLVCSKCKSAFYCDMDCQVAAWPEHKEDCTTIVQSKASKSS
jgi:tetratricopeptide (TPR) repeat protein